MLHLQAIAAQAREDLIYAKLQENPGLEQAARRRVEAADQLLAEARRHVLEMNDMVTRRIAMLLLKSAQLTVATARAIIQTRVEIGLDALSDAELAKMQQKQEGS